jgi:twitching motility protein PilT
MAKLDAFFKLMFDTGASDLHIVSGQPPILRVHGELERVKYDPLDDEHLRQMLYEIAPEQKIKTFEETGDVDFGYEIPHVARFRANYFMQKYGCGAVFRQIPTKVMTADELGLPPILKKSAMLHKGLVLVTGPTGSGKSTTLAAVVDHANKHRKDHIITIEDPIEFVHQAQGCLVNHREVGVHTRSFASALRGALREDPDIIMVGEMCSARCTPSARRRRSTASSRSFRPRSRPRCATASPPASRSWSPRASSSAWTRRGAARRSRSWSARPRSAT